ncbi:MAG: outer membrane protein assembly factor BamA [Elusimicrobia bacterium]|nr:outer membrane protein assembly factor BamA [Elusimicrobiota bacterium]
MVHKFKFIIGSFCLMFFFSTVARAQTTEARQLVGDIAVEGNRTLKKKTVLSKVKVRKGDIVVDPAFRADVDRLLETGQYEDVEVSLEEMPELLDAQGRPQVRVTFHVEERPVIKRIDFKGNLKLADRKFRDEISSKPQEPFDRFKAAQDVEKILSIYRDEGYADAKAEFYTSSQPKVNKVILTFFMTEGSRVLVKSVDVMGNETFSDKKIRRLMKKTRRGKVFKEESLRADLEEVQKYYQNRGYAEAQVSPPARVFNEDHTSVALTLNIDEGRKYTIGNFSFTGATLFKENDLRKALTIKSGALYQQEKLDESQHNIQELYADKGYLRAEIVPENITQPLDEERGRVDIHFSITESSVVYVDRLYVDGNTYTKDQVIRREILLKEGDIFSAGKVRRSVERIYNLGFLDDVQVDVQQPRSPDTADIVFTVQEGKPGILSAGAGYSSVDSWLGTVQVQHINLFGLAQRVNLTWEFGERKQNYEISWTDPWFMGKRMSFGVDMFNTERTIPDAYKDHRKGFGLRLGPRLTDTLSLIHDYRYANVRIFDVDPSRDIQPSHDIISSLTNGFIHDNRDNVFDASRGMRNSVSVEVAGGPFGGNQHFYKPQVSSAIYFPTFWKFVFSLSARGGFVHNFPPSKDVLASERFRMGGVDTVRGYDLDEIGPREYGRAMMVFNAEYKFPIVQERNRTILQGAFFADVGGSWKRGRDVDLGIGSQGDQMRAGVGFGIRFKTPVFPIRLDWGYGLNHRPDEQISQFYFTIGNIF